MVGLFGKLRAQILSLHGVEERPHKRFGKYTYYVGDEEFLHFHGSSQIDVRIPKHLHHKWLRDLRVKVNEYAPERLECDFKDEEDLDFVMNLTRAAYDELVGRREELEGLASS